MSEEAAAAVTRVYELNDFMRWAWPLSSTPPADAVDRARQHRQPLLALPRLDTDRLKQPSHGIHAGTIPPSRPSGRRRSGVAGAGAKSSAGGTFSAVGSLTWWVKGAVSRPLDPDRPLPEERK